MEEDIKNVAEEKKPNPVKTRKKTIGRFIILFIICGWMFTLGVLVGRETAPINFDVKNMKKTLTGDLSTAVEKEKEKTQINVSGDQLTSSGKQDLDFYEDLKSTKEVPENIVIEEVPKQNAVPLPAPQVITSHGKEPKPVKTEEKVLIKEPSLPAKPAGPVLTIQVASSKDQKDADKMVGELNKKGYQAYRSSGDIKGKGIWHRVRIGEFGDRAGAETILNRLKKDKFNGIIVTK